MKRIAALLMILLSLLCLPSCGLKLNTDRIAEQFDKVLYAVSGYQLKMNDDLAGTRSLKDNYTGAYSADYDGQSGRELLFGGALLKELDVAVYGRVSGRQGSARILVKMNGSTSYIETDENGEFFEILHFDSGGNYIIAELEKFCGHIELYSEYVSLR